ncbi:MAG: hypothetical protein RLZZ314_1393 [Bacteroidota bacterium]
MERCVEMLGPWGAEGGQAQGEGDECSHGKLRKEIWSPVTRLDSRGLQFTGACVLLAPKIEAMNTQDIITPLAQFIEWTFNTVLVPMSDGFNWAVIALGGAGLAFWLRLQAKYNAKAEKEGSIM